MTTQVWYNANIVTLDPAQPRAQAVVIRDGRFLFVGSSSEALTYADVKDEISDLGGRTVVPGFNDNHVHAVILGDHVLAPNLSGLSAGEIVESLHEHYPNPSSGELLIGYAWDYPSCPAPHRSILDTAFPNNPVVLPQYGGHGQWLNSQALALMGIGRGTKDPEHGLILRDGGGEPTGILREMSTNSLMFTHFLNVHGSRSRRDKRLGIALDHFRKLGITTVQDNSWFASTVFSLLRLRREKRLSARFSCWEYGAVPETVPFMALPAYDAQWVRRGPRKYFLDGTFTTETAWMWDAYADDPENFGSGMSAKEIAPILELLGMLDMQGAFHAIGDRAISEFLDAFERVRDRFPNLPALRMRLEHAQLIRKEDMPRLRDLGICVSAQPSALGTPDKDVRLLGEDRARSAYPYRSLLEAGVSLSFGSDIPGESSCDPLLAIHNVVNRDSPERIDVESALRCYTEGSAFAEFMELEKGSVRAGMLADFVVLSDDITSVETRSIKNLFVEFTVVGGTVMFERLRTQSESTVLHE